MLLWITFDGELVNMSQDIIAMKECGKPEIHVDTKEPYGYFYVGY